MVLRTMEKLLIRKSRHAKSDPERYERKVSPPPQVGDLVKRIRSGHSLGRVKEDEKEVER